MRKESDQIAEIQVLYRCNLGGTNHLGNFQLICGTYNGIKGNRGMEYLVARLPRG